MIATAESIFGGSHGDVLTHGCNESDKTFNFRDIQNQKERYISYIKAFKSTKKKKELKTHHFDQLQVPALMGEPMSSKSVLVNFV